MIVLAPKPTSPKPGKQREKKTFWTYVDNPEEEALPIGDDEEDGRVEEQPGVGPRRSSRLARREKEKV